MEMKRVSAGDLRAIGYDESNRLLRVELGNGRLVEYSGVSAETWRRLSSAGSMWSFFRDNIEENYSERQVR
ncbi:MAG: KTSC domain-containing protein [Pseudomonadota bacterium]|nr:KTSC domain-containing protein [Pseudomonadota bacterium]